LRIFPDAPTETYPNIAHQDADTPPAAHQLHQFQLLETSMTRSARIKPVALTLACAAVGSILLTRSLVAAPVADAPLDSSVPTSQPSGSETPARSYQDITTEYRAVAQQLNSVLPSKILSDPEKRDQAAPQAIPILFHRLQLTDELATTKKVPAVTIAALKQNSQAILYLLNDQPTVTQVKEMAASANPNRQIQGKSVEILSQWLGAGSDEAQGKKAVDEVEALDKANPADSRLTVLTISMAQSSHTAALNGRLIALVTDVMTDPYAVKVKSQIAAQKKAEDEAQAKQNAMLNQPFTITGKTVDGKDFNTADWKGKVVLVDFWATWCGPCKAGLPHVKEIYSQYHGKGLEILGVSNDFDAKALSDFTPKNNMPWPQLFDADAAAKQQWNPITLSNGIHGIPCMFLIDKKGVLRSVTARADMDDLVPKLLAE
jgi:thiol-disulfide isomerase/thioredoxin